MNTVELKINVKRELQNSRRLIVEKTLRRGLLLLVALLTIAPITRLVYILATTGANTPSSDDEQFIPFFLGQIMSGRYNWLHFPRDTFQNTHVTMVPALVYVAMGYLDHLNIYHLLYLGILLAAVKMVLLHNTFTASTGKRDRTLSLLLWPILSWLIFSVSQMSVFEHGFQSLKTAFNELGLALGIWAMIRFRKRWTAIWLMGLGGIIASFSFACGLNLWLLFVAGMFIAGFRKKSQYLAVFGMAAVAAAPYVDLLYLHRVEARQTAIASVFNLVMLINYLGRPFTNGSGLHYERMAMSEVAGIVGLLLLAAGIWLTWRDRRAAALEQTAPGLMLAAFSLLAGWQITLYRAQLAPWYITFATDFWIGLVGIACVVWSRHAGCGLTIERGRGYEAVAQGWSIAVVAIIIALYIASNRTRSDKSFFLRTRAPVSAACLRSYGTAPTYCEQTLVPWEAGFPGYLAHLGMPLAEHNLSVFAPHQEWSLQGDFILDTVRLHEAPGSPEVYWSPDLSGRRADFADYNHLNLVVSPPDWVAWSISLPAGLDSAVFHSSASIAGAKSNSVMDTQITLSVSVEEAGAPPLEVFSWSAEPRERTWHPFSVPLTDYGGKSITLKLSATGQGNGVPGIFKYPYIDLSIKGSGNQVPSLEPVRPSNTDLSAVCPAPDAVDYRLDVTDGTRWKADGLVGASSGDETVKSWVVSEANPSLEYTAPLDVDLSNYSHFFIQMAASAEIDHRAVRIYYKTDPRQEFNEGEVLVIPLLADGGMHIYTYDLKITGIRRSRLAGIKIVPIRPPSLSPANHIEIAGFGLIRRGVDGRDSGSFVKH